jgi:exopolysaccharide biosynthesis polyprenyl glycosylphosphotransferase
MVNINEYRQFRLALLELIGVVVAVAITTQLPTSKMNQIGTLLIIALHFVAFYFSRMSSEFESRGYLIEFERVARYVLIFDLLLISFSFLLGDSFIITRRGLALFTILTFIIVYIINCTVRRYKYLFLMTAEQQKNTLVITTTERLRLMEGLFESDQLPTKYLAGIVVIGDGDVPFPEGVPLVPFDDAIEFATHEVVDRVFINLPSEHYDLKHLVSDFEVMGIDVSVDINSFDFRALKNKKIKQVGDHSIVTFNSNYYKPSHIFLKRTLDIFGALIGLLICGLVGIVLAPIIRKDGGPAIFVQNRVGKNGRIFKFYKFRSMYIDAEERKKELMSQNQMQGGMFKMDNDPRITPIGNFIRKTSLDELPQFFNVLVGDMSLVGTRPPTVDEFEQYTPSQKRRLSFKPGITGLWQVSGRSNITNFDEVVKLDVEYIDNWSIWSDIKILLKTIVVVFKKEGSK